MRCWRDLVGESVGGRDYLPLEGEDPLASLASLEDIRGECGNARGPAREEECVGGLGSLFLQTASQ